jgi:hypothetical protein
MKPYLQMTDDEKIAVHIEDGRAQLLKDCRLIGISAHKIKDINVLAAEYVKKINFIRRAV